MPKNKPAPLSDWRVDFTISHPPQVVRATSVHTDGGWLHLRDSRGGVLFACPSQHVAHVRRMEPGEDAKPAEPQAPAPDTRGGYRGGLPASEVGPPSPVPSASMQSSAGPGSAAAEKVTPARPRGGRRAK